MSWSPDLYIGEMRPWPDSVHVMRGSSGEARRYVPERKDAQEALERRIDELCAEVERLHADQAHWELGNCPSCPNVVSLQEALEQNDKLRELASILCFCMQVHAQCDDCKLNGAKGELAHDPLCACDGLHEILRELGIEVTA